ncbi:hypothetical protein PSTG_17180 [Puccinia striiformis f. sp. tritici PST-78]|uniref:Uncharacterized protein n=1 Tax=Puccinia striiformis f. sp. tritici PST-78 TaxID=1165861 RepID=A0A0L0UQJ3_9BASI|nr:hypothetical protein PSTG_17180 [Puccinia striiformis f. sp. tritici PST-78]
MPILPVYPLYITDFLQSSYKQIVMNRRLWGANIGWCSTLEVLNSTKRLVCKTKAAQSQWKNYILLEASTLFLLLIYDFAQEILEAEGGAHGRFPGGNYYNSSKITPSFFDDKPKSDRVAKLVNQAEKVNFGNSDSGDKSDGPTRKSAPPIPVREATPEDLLASDDILNADNTIDSNKKTPQAEEREGEIYDRAD